MDEVTLVFRGPGKEINDFSYALFEVDSLGHGTQKAIPGGGTLTMQPMMMQKSAGHKVIEIVLTMSSSVGLGIVSNYIYDKLKSHSGENLEMTVNRREVKFNNKGEIAKIIEEEIKIKHEKQ